MSSRGDKGDKADDETFSAGSVARQLDYCTFCPKMCRHACPVSTASGRETYIPQVKMDRLNQLRRRRRAWCAAPGAHELQRAVPCTRGATVRAAAVGLQGAPRDRGRARILA